eukprot:Sspe_Gene.16236::Locus_5719_Transcript_1_1_Confidence_1.000_Length_1598::g.16236::m.16236
MPETPQGTQDTKSDDGGLADEEITYDLENIVQLLRTLLEGECPEAKDHEPEVTTPTGTPKLDLPASFIFSAPSPAYPIPSPIYGSPSGTKAHGGESPQPVTMGPPPIPKDRSRTSNDLNQRSSERSIEDDDEYGAVLEGRARASEKSRLDTCNVLMQLAASQSVASFMVKSCNAVPIISMILQNPNNSPRFKELALALLSNLASALLTPSHAVTRPETKGFYTYTKPQEKSVRKPDQEELATFMSPSVLAAVVTSLPHSDPYVVANVLRFLRVATNCESVEVKSRWIRELLDAKFDLEEGEETVSISVFRFIIDSILADTLNDQVRLNILQLLLSLCYNSEEAQQAMLSQPPPGIPPATPTASAPTPQPGKRARGSSSDVSDHTESPPPPKKAHLDNGPAPAPSKPSESYHGVRWAAYCWDAFSDAHKYSREDEMEVALQLLDFLKQSHHKETATLVASYLKTAEEMLPHADGQDADADEEEGEGWE